MKKQLQEKLKLGGNINSNSNSSHPNKNEEKQNGNRNLNNINSNIEPESSTSYTVNSVSSHNPQNGSDFIKTKTVKTNLNPILKTHVNSDSNSNRNCNVLNQQQQ